MLRMTIETFTKLGSLPTRKGETYRACRGFHLGIWREPHYRQLIGADTDKAYTFIAASKKMTLLVRHFGKARRSIGCCALALNAMLVFSKNSGHLWARGSRHP